MKRICFYVISILCFFFISCKSEENIIDLSYNLSYYEASPYTKIYEVRSNSPKFKHLQPEDKSNLAKLLEDKDNYLWIKTNFTIPDKMKFRSLGLFIPQLRSANEVWLNGIYIGSSGDLPPYEFSSGFGAHYYFLQDRVLNFDKSNSLIIKVWPGPIGVISDSIYITEAKTAQKKATLLTFFNSKVFLAFAILLLFVTFYYILLFFMQKNHPHNICYLMFSMVCFFSFIFLVPFFASEIPWINLNGVSYLTFIKIFLCCGGFITLYSVKSFIDFFIEVKRNRLKEVIRMSILLSQITITVIQPDFQALVKTFPYILATMIIQLLFIIDVLGFSFFKLEKRTKVLNILLGFSPVLISIVIDFIVRTILHNKNFPYITIYGWQFTLLTFLLYLITDFNKMYARTIELSKELKSLNMNLEDEIQKRTFDLKQTNNFLAEQVSRANDDLRTAKYVQQELLPKKNVSYNGWDISVHYQPLNNVSGNLYDYFSEEDSLYGIGLFDFSEHGTSAGLFTMLAKTIIAQSFIKSFKENKTSGEILYDINRNLTSNKNKIYKQIFGEIIRIGKFEEDYSCAVEVSSASMPECLYFNSQNEEVISLEIQNISGMPSVLGNTDSSIFYNQNEFRMYPNDTLVLLTNGFVKAENIAKNRFDTNTIVNILKRHKFDSTEKITAAIISAFENFLGNTTVKDDFTVIVLKRRNVN